MFCENCGTQVEEQDLYCPKCGARIEREAPKSEEIKAEQSVPQKPLRAKLGKKAKEQKDQAAEGTAQKAPKKKKKWILPLVIAGVILLTAGGGIFAIRGYVGNFFQSIFSKPAQYFQYVEKKEVDQIASTVAQVYDSYFLPALSAAYDGNITTDIRFSFGEEGKEILGLAGQSRGVDLSWIKGLRLSATTNVRDNFSGVNAELLLNDDKILSAEFLSDMEQKDNYLLIPELSSSYIGMEQVNMERMLGVTGLLRRWRNPMLPALDTKSDTQTRERLVQALPSKSVVEKLLKKYLHVIVDSMEDVSIKKNMTVKAGDLKQDAVRLRLTIDGKQLQVTGTKLLLIAMEDKDLKDIIIKVAEALQTETDAETVYRNVQESMEKLHTRLVDGDMLNKNLVFTIYVNKKGEIVSRKLGDEEDTFSIEFKMPKQSGKTGYELRAVFGGQSIGFQGSGKISFGKLQGDYQVVYNNIGVVEGTINKLDMDKSKNAELDADVTMQFAPGAMELLRMPSLVSHYLNDMELSTKLQTQKGSYQASLTAASGKEEKDKIGFVEIGTQIKKGKKMSAPNAKKVVFMEEEADIKDWLDTVNWSKYISKLGKTDIPQKYVDMLEMIVARWE